MNIFEKRPLSLILCVALGVFSLFSDLPIYFKLSFSALSFICVLASFFYKRDFFDKHGITRGLLIAVGAAFLLSAIWQAVFFPSKHYNKTVEVDAKIYDIDKSRSSFDILDIKTEKINGMNDEHKIIVYIDKKETAYLKKYDIVSFEATITPLESTIGDFDTRAYQISRGYSAFAEFEGELSINGNETDDIDKILSDIRLKVSNTLKKRTDYQTGAFLTALIIGDRTDLDGNTNLNFLRTGISHILALSGMHIALLSLLLNKLLSMLRVGKRSRIVAVAVFVLFYIGITGFSTSVARAGIMLMITGLLFLLKYKSDSITSLFISIAVILTISPNAVYDMSLWLSAFATLGVICYSEISSESDDKPTTWIKKQLKLLKDAALISVFAFGATFCICAVKLDSMSVISIISTILFSFITNLLIYLGIIILLIGNIFKIGSLAIILSDFIKEFAEVLSDIKWIYVSTESIVTKVFIIAFCLMFFGFLVSSNKSKGKAILTISISLLLVFTSGIIDTSIKRAKDDVIYAPMSSGDALVLKSDNVTTVIYTGKATTTSLYDLVGILNDNKVMYIDNFVFSSYNYNNISFSQNILDAIKLQRILLPYPETDDEINQVEGISDLMSLYGAELSVYNMLDTLRFGEFEYKLYHKSKYKYGTDNISVFTVNTDKSEYSYISSSDKSNLNADARMLLYNTENLIIGNGSPNTEFSMTLPYIKSIYCADVNKFTEDVDKYYKKREVSVNSTETPISVYNFRH